MDSPAWIGDRVAEILLSTPCNGFGRAGCGELHAKPHVFQLHVMDSRIEEKAKSVGWSGTFNSM